MKNNIISSNSGFLAFIVLLLLISSVEAQVGNSDRSPRSRIPNSSNGEAAIRALGRDLPEAARKSGISADQLHEIFLKDQNVYVDSSNEIFIVESDISLHSNGEMEGQIPEGAPPFDSYSTSQAFNLNSKPGSNRVIYLNFIGKTVNNTAWNSSVGSNYYFPPFDIDNAPNSFSETERGRIIEIWRRVSEDFAMFDVNITTAFPGQDAISRSSSSDQTYGTEVLITRSNSAICTNCGGVAYLSVFSNTSDFYKPALVFFNALASNPKYIAEAVSHEAGHNLGLHHDGTTSGVVYYQGHGSGETSWAPIMGNSYSKNVTQWSRGEYTGANNSQDDFVVMNNNGLPYRQDDHGNSMANATHINESGNFSVEGIIERSNDVDFFSINSGVGDITVYVSSASVGPNLDIELDAYNPAGNLIARSNPENLLSTGLSFQASQEGKYYFRVRGVGVRTPSTGYSEYASLGYYKIDGSYNPVTNNVPPQAHIQASVTSGVSPLTVQFSGAGSSDPDGSIVSYGWNFGDGTSSSGINVSRTFSAGSYQVSLTVVDDKGLSSSATVQINVSQAPNQAPIAVASSNLTSGFAPLAVQFSSSGSHDPDGTISSYHWNFGDGKTSNSPNPSNTYNSAGTFLARLTVTDNNGATASSTIQINVSTDMNQILAPSQLTASSSGGNVFLSWIDNSSNENGFRIYRGLETGKGKNRKITWSVVNVSGANVTAYTDSGMPTGAYHYQVEAFNSVTQAFSNSVRVNFTAPRSPKKSMAIKAPKPKKPKKVSSKGKR
ncbi:MAG TPA: PKD domain-containing protein [Oligoflexia bacterium]|nr:PKD domain-containing protein [Oligoflexia bacterium]HMP47241.1 PKD domain-containing protein [Oligoflexia bacterium]